MSKNILLSLFILYSFSCERKAVETSKVRIQLPNFQNPSKDQVGILGSGAPPTTLNDMDCFGFIVGGPESSLRQNSCELLSGSTGSKENDIYFASLHAGYYKGIQAEFDVPSGTDRVITAVGFQTHMTEANGAAEACKNMLNAEQNSFSKGFVISTVGRIKVEPGSTQSIAMPMSYSQNSTAFLGDCKGPVAPGPGPNIPNGPPVKIRMRFQNNLTSIIQHTCVPVAFELLDANGNLATVTEALSFTISESVNARFDDFTNLCDSAGTLSKFVNFYDGDNRFSRVVLFFRHVGTGPTTFAIAQNSGSPVLAETLPNVTVLSTSSPSPDYPYAVNVFDVDAFRGSQSTSASTPIEIQAGQCRRAYVQVLDNVGRPLKVYNNNGGGPGNDIISTISTFAGFAGAAELSSSSNCSGAIPTQVMTVPSSSYQVSGLNKFYYQVPAASPNMNFNFTVAITGSGYYNISEPIQGLNPQAAVNNKSFWKIKN